MENIWMVMEKSLILRKKRSLYLFILTRRMAELFLFTFKSVSIYFKMNPNITFFKLKNDCEDVCDWLHAF